MVGPSKSVISSKVVLPSASLARGVGGLDWGPLSVPLLRLRPAPEILRGSHPAETTEALHVCGLPQRTREPWLAHLL